MTTGAATPRQGDALEPRPGEVAAGWAPLRPPFSTARESLAEAERHLSPHQGGEPASASDQRWDRLRDAVGDQDAVAEAVNDLLSAVLAGWQIRQTPAGAWRVHLAPTAGTAKQELVAVQALVLLVEAGGWSRLRRCAAPGCATVFLDATSGGNRRACRTHQRDR